MTTGTPNENQGENNDDDAADAGQGEDTFTTDTEASAPGACIDDDLTGCTIPANAAAVGCTLGTCAFECDAGYYDINQDLGQPNSDGCEYACTPTNGGVEICDNVDNNCDGQIDGGLTGTHYKDEDGDGFGATQDSNPGCDFANGYTTTQDGDCNDDDPSIYPGAPTLECVSDTDYNCNQKTSCDNPECLGEVCKPDGVTTCGSGPIKCISEDDEEVEVEPEVPAEVACVITNEGVEVCDGQDNDCNGEIDDGLEAVWHYLDADGDGYGDAAKDSFGFPINHPRLGCDFANHPDYTAPAADDCDDSRADIHPGAPILECSSDTDYNCNGNTGCADWGCANESCGNGKTCGTPPFAECR